jgi:lysophospholipase L1-like esterase
MKMVHFRKILYLSIGLLLFGYSSALTLYYDVPQKLLAKIIGPKTVDSAWSQYWQSKVDITGELRKNPDVIMLGDSITAGAEWNEYFDKYTVINRGIGGDTSEGVLKRIDEVIRRKPKSVFLLIGINDVAGQREVHGIAENTKKIVSSIQSAGIKVYIQSVLPVAKEYKGARITAADINSRVEELNGLYRNIGASLGVEFVDIASGMIDPEGYLDSSLTYDNIHLKAVAYQKWIGVLRSLVE